MAIRRICSVEDCGKPHLARGWCGLHYQRWSVSGDPSADRPARSNKGEAQRFFREVVLTYEGDECLIWPYSRDNYGYGYFGSHAEAPGGPLLRQGPSRLCHQAPSLLEDTQRQCRRSLNPRRSTARGRYRERKTDRRSGQRDTHLKRFMFTHPSSQNLRDEQSRH